MGKPTGFLEYKRETPAQRDPKERINDWKEIYIEMSDRKKNEQAARCMDCGVPFCHHGCPLGNFIPDFNDAIYRKNWKQAYQVLDSTNNFPEFTGRICPAPCEQSCVVNLEGEPITIHFNERNIIEMAFELGIVKPNMPLQRTGKKVAVIGSGPSGLAAASQLNKAGHSVTVFERDDKAGGLLRYGIPDFKLEKWVIDRRIAVMEEEGIVFKTSTNVGVDIKGDQLLKDFDAVVLTGGSTIPRDLPIPGRELKGVYFAMEYLKQSNKRVAGYKIEAGEEINPVGKNVVVIGGGDTGSDCVGTSNRLKANSVTQIELMPKPPVEREESNPWPQWPLTLKTSSSHDEGCNRFWSINTKEFIGDGKGNLKAIKVVDVEWDAPAPGKRPSFHEVAGSEREIPCEYVFLAMGFLHPQKQGLIEQLGVELDERGNVKAKTYQTSVKKVFSAGDMRTGQSLVVRCIADGREAAKAVDEYLSGFSLLESINLSLANIAQKA
jgi:glutamate synthase (NADPH/NADH) small chain